MSAADLIREWVVRLSQTCPATNDLPTCPYARRAFESGKVRIVCDDDLRTVIDEWSDAFDVVLCIVDRNAITADRARAAVDMINEKYRPLDFVVMVDHPDQPFIVDGHSNSNGERVIFFIQRQSSLNRAANALKARGYYNKWPDGEG